MLHDIKAIKNKSKFQLFREFRLMIHKDIAEEKKDNFGILER